MRLVENKKLFLTAVFFGWLSGPGNGNRRSGQLEISINELEKKSLESQKVTHFFFESSTSKHVQKMRKPQDLPWICHGSEAKQLIAAEGHLNKLQGDGAITAAEAALKAFRSAGPNGGLGTCWKIGPWQVHGNLSVQNLENLGNFD